MYISNNRTYDTYCASLYANDYQFRKKLKRQEIVCPECDKSFMSDGWEICPKCLSEQEEK